MARPLCGSRLINVEVAPVTRPRTHTLLVLLEAMGLGEDASGMHPIFSDPSSVSFFHFTKSYRMAYMLL